MPDGVVEDDVDEGPAVDTAGSHPADGEVLVCLFDLYRQGISAPGQRNGEMDGGIEQPAIARLRTAANGS
jgi:hypothetical protein